MEIVVGEHPDGRVKGQSSFELREEGLVSGQPNGRGRRGASSG